MKKVLIITLGVVLVAAALIISRHQPAPAAGAVYQGRTAQEWLGEVFTTNQAAAFQAFRAMGTNGLPAIVHGFEYRDSAWAKFYQRIYPKLPAMWQRRHSPPVSEQAMRSSAGLLLLNTGQQDARPILPALVKLLAEKDQPARGAILSASTHLFRPGDSDYVPILAQCFADPNNYVRLPAATCLASIGPAAKPAIPALTAALKDPDLNLRLNAAWTLWQIDHQTNAVTPALREV
ncbi:MAG TPA: HEAT repeat domain-containing protein, partial [Verrucomicrobiaceae bacterium]